MITRPYGLTLQDWADQVVTDLGQQGYIGRLDPGQLWQEWAAAQVLALPALRGIAADPYQFTTWQEWAERLCSLLI